jgi:citrate/tricarballylate utilization protein
MIFQLPTPRTVTNAPSETSTFLVTRASLTGLLLLVLRETVAMGPLLIVHLGIVLALFLALPYGKFVHGLYRYAALLRHDLETEEPERREG